MTKARYARWSAASGWSFGARPVTCFMADEFQDTTLFRVRKCMRELGIRGCMPYKSKRTAISNKNAKT